MLLACCRLSAQTDVGTSISFWMRCEIIKCICYIELSLIVQKQGRKTRIEWHAVFGCDWRGHFNFILNEVWNNKNNMLSWIIFNCIKMSRLFVERGIICLIVITGAYNLNEMWSMYANRWLLIFIDVFLRNTFKLMNTVMTCFHTVCSSGSHSTYWDIFKLRLSPFFQASSCWYVLISEKSILKNQVW